MGAPKCHSRRGPFRQCTQRSIWPRQIGLIFSSSDYVPAGLLIAALHIGRSYGAICRVSVGPVDRAPAHHVCGSDGIAEDA